jgi:hypothetical protein
MILKYFCPTYPFKKKYPLTKKIHYIDMNMVRKNESAVYESPRVELCEVSVEQGFSATGVYNEQVGGRTEEESW